MKNVLLVIVACLTMLPMTLFARGRVGVFIGPGFGPYYGGFGWYAPYGPYGMYSYGPYFSTPNAGEVKLDTNVRDAEVFINGDYAGTVRELKTMTMRSGTYDIEVRAPGRNAFQQRIYVVAGKTLKLHPDLGVLAPPPPTGS